MTGSLKEGGASLLVINHLVLDYGVHDRMW